MHRSQMVRMGVLVFLLLLVPCAWCQDGIPKAAWKRPIGERLQNPGTRKPSLEPSHIDDGFWQGAPVGGFGSGTFSQTYRGDFARWHLEAGVHKYQPIYANAFAMFQQVEGEPGTARALVAGHPSGSELSSWSWDYPVGAGDYYALYPKSWFDYKWSKFPAHVYVEQFSPVLPDNYRESSYPVAVYRWHAENPTNHAITVSILLSWTNMGGWLRSFSRDFRGTLNNENHNRFESSPLGNAGTMKGILFDRNGVPGKTNAWDGQIAIASVESPGVEITYQTTYEADGDGRSVWEPFAKDGRLSNSDQQWTSTGEPLAGAIAVRFTLKPGEKRVIPVIVAWDFPVVEFGDGRQWNRRYTDFYGASGKNAWAIAKDGLLNSAAWSRAIDSWQAPYVNDESKPLWYRGALFNELYTVADTGSFWGRPVGEPKTAPATFAFMECYDYPFYATLDVRFYGSMPLVKFWPEIDKQVLREFADTVPEDLPEKGLWSWKSLQEKQPELKVRKKKGAVPHDLGTPDSDPFHLVNQFGWQDTNGWKDLNSKYVLMVYRDFVLTGRKDTAFLKYTWPSVKESIAYLEQFDHGSGVPENGGYPDQTYDTWIVKGVSAYSGGLWLAALRASEEMARVLNDSADRQKYHDMFSKAQHTYIQDLWNGQYFRYDTESDYRDSIQSDQLAGQWYANMTGLGDLVPHDMIVKSLQKIFDFNVMKFANGEMGAINGIAPDGSLIFTNEQVHEVWTGVTYSLAALMLSEGMKDEGYKTAWGIYHVTYETKGYWFRTPEAWDETGNYRASMYMRPAAIWAMEMLTPPGPPKAPRSTAKVATSQ
ncbi:MAG TPA: non-lysosomal glucosylceramidase [Candidatus Limnocylindrales bacterium]|nr:non-lysosomal glucosylceramidase [Candidatus Limnocylindrales bacterium]